MVKQDLYAIVAEEAGLSQAEAKRAVNAVLKAITSATLKGGDEVRIAGFGKFYASVLPKRKIKLPSFPNYEREVDAPPMMSLRFKPYKGARRYLRKK